MCSQGCRHAHVEYRKNIQYVYVKQNFSSQKREKETGRDSLSLIITLNINLDQASVYFMHANKAYSWLYLPILQSLPRVRRFAQSRRQRWDWRRNEPKLELYIILTISSYPLLPVKRTWPYFPRYSQLFALGTPRAKWFIVWKYMTSGGFYYQAFGSLQNQTTETLDNIEQACVHYGASRRSSPTPHDSVSGSIISSFSAEQTTPEVWRKDPSSTILFNSTGLFEPDNRPRTSSWPDHFGQSIIGAYKS